jgi:hypothetical protein
VRTQLAIAAFAVAAALYQTSAQILDLPGRLTPFAFAATVVWTLTSVGLLGLVARWAGSVRHRRQAHRFPVRLDVTYADQLGCKGPGVARDLNPFGMALDASSLLVVGESVHITLPLGGEPITVAGIVAAARPLGEGAYRVGIRFDDLGNADHDAIVRWCFTHPFGEEWGRAEPSPVHQLPARDAERPARAA